MYVVACSMMGRTDPWPMGALGPKYTIGRVVVRRRMGRRDGWVEYISY